MLARILGATELPRDAAAAAAVLRASWPVGPTAAPDRARPRGEVASPLIAARDVTFRYPAADRDALGPVTLALTAGTMTAFVGANGAGKSTLGLVLAGASRPRSGEVTFDRRAASDAAARGEIAYVFQFPERGFLTPTVREEVAYSARVRGLPPGPEVDLLIERFGLAPLAAANPHSLSHGEKRRLSVAAALASRPRALILDEPTFGQDWRHARELLAALEDERRRGTLIVLITHDLSLVADHADRVIALEAGRVAFDGTPTELFMNDDVLAACALVRPPVAEAFRLARAARPDIPPLIGLGALRSALPAAAGA